MNTKNFTQKLWKAALLVAVFFIGFNNLKAGSTNNDDVGLSAFLSPVTNVCGDSNTLITVTLNNIGKNSQSKIPIVVKISGSATATYKDTFYSSLSSGGTTSFSFILKLNTFSGGTFSLKAYTAMSTDQDAANDTILTSVTINPQAPTPTVTGASACGFTSLTLRASSAPKGAKNVWYNASTGGSIIATGDSFVTPFISSTTTYYVETAYPKYYSTGKPNKTTGTGGNYTAYADGLVFEAFSDFTFDSVTVYPNASGRVVMRLTDSATGNIIDSHSVAVKVTTANDPIRIPVGYKIKAGKYRLFATGTTTGGMYRNTGSGGIPYSVAGILSITRTINNLAGYYYFFYDWKISNYTGCPSARVAVTATITSGSKPTVSFTTKGSCLGTATTFTDGSSAASGTTLTKFKYDFGDGNTYTSTSTGSTTHTYASAGTYKITYYVTASNGCSDTSGTFITITAGSTPNFTTSSSCGGVVTFTDASVVSGTITSYDYDFGDTSTYSSSTTGSTTHTYKYAGNHTVKFSLTNSGGCTFTKTQTVTATISPNAPTGTGASACGYSSLVLKANTPPSGAKNYWYNVSSGGTSLATGDSFVTPFISATTNFYVEAAYTTSGRLGAKDNTIGAGGNNATVTNGLIFYALSDFTLDSLTVYPNNTGTMNVVIKIRDSATKKVVDSVIRSVTTSTAFQKVRIAVGIKVPKGGAYTIDGEGSSTGGFYRNTAGGKIPYVLTGVAKITETKNSLASTGYYYYFYDWLVSASSCPSSRTTVTATITSGSTPTVKFSALPSCSGSPSLFLDSSKAASGGSIASYTYQFGDGNTMNTTSNKVTHTYTTTGTFKVTLLVRGGNGCADTMSKFITIVNGPKAGVTASYVCTGSTASFTDNSLGNGGTITNYVVDFGDTTTGSFTSTPVTHTYKFAGTYKVMYKVITAQGCVDSTTVTITVNQTPATPSVTGASSCNPPAVLKLAAYNAASGLYHLWYNNATTDTVVTAGDTLTTPSISSSKTYYVKAVTMAGLGFVGRAARGVFNGNQNNSNGLRFKVFKTVFIDSMVVYPNASGMFYLVFTDSTTGLKDSMPITVKVATANALTWIYVKKFILPGVYTITASQPASGGTGGFSRSTFAGTAFPYTIPNYITIQGNTTASTTNYLFFYNWHVSAIGCESNRAAVTATIGTGSKPVAKFSAANGCINTSISFKDASTVSTGSIAAYQYDFGDGSSLYNSTSTGNTTHTYTASGTYKVLATVTSSGGCYDTTSRMVTVYANPVVNFGASSSCLSFPVKFTDSSTLNAASATYSWVFEVGKTATIQNPSYTYGSSGTKTVTLTLTNSNGCIVARTKAVNVLADPSAKFSSSIVSGKTYSFTPNDTNLANYIWKFGDGNTSTSKKPNYTYATTGTYTVKLSVDNGQGCTAIDSTTIVITALEGSNENFSLAVSPNPFSTQTTISYSLAKATNLRISLMDITGRQIALLNDGVQTQGTYNTTISANNYHLSAGIYMVRFELDGKTVVRQIVKLRE